MQGIGRSVISVDFDGTLSFGIWPGTGKANTSLFGWLNYQKEYNNAAIILNTCRTGADLETAVAYCKERGLEFDAVNENLPEVIEMYGGDCRKINADMYIDDKAINPFMGMFSILPDGYTQRKESDQ